MIESRLLPDLITIRKPVQSMVPGTKTPVFEFQDVATGVRARFNPANTNLSRNVLGQTPKRTFRLFLNLADLKENYEVVRESDGEVFAVTEVKGFFGHHLEAVLEEKR
jgi:hypothetical protein